MSSQLLPPNSTALERSITDATVIDLETDSLRHIESAALCPLPLLPWLAWERSVDDWDDSWQPSIQRQVTAESLAVHRQKGTVASVRRVLSAAGYPYAAIDEQRGGHRRDGSIRRDGWPTHGARVPFVYRVHLNGLVNLRQAAQIIRMLSNTAPVRSHLHSLDYRGAPLLHNGAASRDGSYTRGVVYG